MKKKEIKNYLEGFIKGKEIEQNINSSNIFNEEGFNLWSFKKLIFLEHYIKPFLTILSNKGGKCFFIDFFSSCGANKIKERDIISIGSPIISLLKGVIPLKKDNKILRFHKWFFVDNNEVFCKSLKARISKTCQIIEKNYGEKLEKDISVLYGDCNEKISEIISEIQKESQKDKITILAFVDPYKYTDINWETLRKLLSLKYVDLIFTFPTLSLKRGFGQCKDNKKYLPPTLIELCGDKKINEIAEIYSSLYAKDIVNIINRSINYYKQGVSVRNSNEGEIYRIELFTFSTIIAKISLDIVKMLNSIKTPNLSSMLEQIKGKQKSLMDFKDKI